MATEVDPLAFQKGYAATQNLFDNAQQNRLQQMTMQRAEDAYQQEQAANRLLAAAVGPEGTIDRTKALTGYAQAGLGSKIPALQTQFAQQDKAQREAQKAQIEQHIQMFDVASRVLSGVKDQAGYDQARAELAQFFPEQAAKMPAVYDAATIEANRMKALPLVEQLKQQYQQMQFAETQRHNQATEGLTAQGQQLTTRGQNLTAETARRGQDLTDARAREEGALKRADSKTAQAQQERVRDANDALGLLDQAEKLIPQATGSYLGAGRDIALRSIGAATDAGNAAAQLRALEGALVSKMPKMSGPQSDKDVAMYRQMAGQIGDNTVPAETKMAAIKTIREIQNKYAGNATAPGAPAAGKAPAQPDALAELQRRAASDPALAAKLKAMGY